VVLFDLFSLVSQTAALLLESLTASVGGELAFWGLVDRLGHEARSRVALDAAD